MADYGKVFISHSKRDPNLGFFQSLFAMLRIESTWIELEDVVPPPSVYIREQVNQSDAVFVLLSQPLTELPHTNNWVAFEVGLAANCGAQGLDVWVFEPLDEHIDFAVPYFTHYMRYHTERNALTWLRDMLRETKAESIGIPVQCSYDDCKIAFNYLSRYFTNDFYCPACRRFVHFIKKYEDLVKERDQALSND